MKTRIFVALVTALALNTYSVAQNTFADLVSGVRYQTGTSAKSQSYYKLELLGRRFESGDRKNIDITQHDAVIPAALSLQPLEPNRWRLSYENGLINSNGSVFEGLLLDKIHLNGLEDVMGSGYLSGANDGKSLAFAVGLARAGSVIPAIRSRGMSNYYLIGIAAERTEDTNSKQDENLGVATARLEFAKALRWQRQDVKEEPFKKTVSDFLERHKSYAQLRAHLVEVFKDRDVKDLSQNAVKYNGEVIKYKYDEPFTVERQDLTFKVIAKLDPATATEQEKDVWLENVATYNRDGVTEDERQIFFQAMNVKHRAAGLDNEDQAAWEQLVALFMDLSAESGRWFPMYSWFGEASAWAPFTKSSFDRKPIALVTTGFKYWPVKNNRDILLQLGYEYGFAQSSPDVRRRDFVVSAAIRF